MTKDRWRLPDGSYTKDKREYSTAWREKGNIVKKLTGLSVNGYDYGLVSFISDDKKNTITLPSWFIDLLEDNMGFILRQGESKKEKEPKKKLFGK